MNKMYYKFEPEKVRNEIVKGIKEFAESEGFSKVVIGISGGKDSTITAALCVRALGKENVYGVMLPDGIQKDFHDSQTVCKLLQIPHATVNIKAMHDAMHLSLELTGTFHIDNVGMEAVTFNKEADINVAPRLRMTVLRYFTQALNARLAGTGNLSESITGYCTKDGDTSCDFSVLGGLTSVEVVQVGLTMPEIPKELVLKTPADGLSGKSDEERLGVSYEEIHHYIRSDAEISEESWRKIDKLMKRSVHKRRMPPCVAIPHPFSNLWGRYI